jgi:hypothetical protein
MKDSNNCTSAAGRVYPQSDFIISRARCGYQSYTTEKEHYIRAEIDAYSRLGSL